MRFAVCRALLPAAICLPVLTCFATDPAADGGSDACSLGDFDLEYDGEAGCEALSLLQRRARLATSSHASSEAASVQGARGQHNVPLPPSVDVNKRALPADGKTAPRVDKVETRWSPNLALSMPVGQPVEHANASHEKKSIGDVIAFAETRSQSHSKSEFDQKKREQQLVSEQIGALCIALIVGIAIVVILVLFFAMNYVALDSHDTSKPLKPSSTVPGASQAKPTKDTSGQLKFSPPPAAQAVLPKSSGSTQQRTSPDPYETAQPLLVTENIKEVVLESAPAAPGVAPSMMSSAMNFISGSAADAPLSTPAAAPLPKGTSFSSSLIVQSGEGVVLQADNRCSPHHEKRNISFRSLKGANAVVRARIDETQGGSSRIMVSSASGVPLAVVDTTRAAYAARQSRPHPSERWAHIHRVTGKSFELLGPPCASVIPVAAKTYKVRSATPNANPHVGHASGSNDAILTVQVDDDGNILRMDDPSGHCVVRQAAIGTQQSDLASNIWLQQGADVTLIVSVALAVQKLF